MTDRLKNRPIDNAISWDAHGTLAPSLAQQAPIVPINVARWKSPPLGCLPCCGVLREVVHIVVNRAFTGLKILSPYGGPGYWRPVGAVTHRHERVAAHRRSPAAATSAPVGEFDSHLRHHLSIHKGANTPSAVMCGRCPRGSLFAVRRPGEGGRAGGTCILCAPTQDKESANSVPDRDQLTPILRTKLYRPPEPEHILCRQALHQLLDSGPRAHRCQVV